MKKIDFSFEKIEPFFEKIGKLPKLHRYLICVGIVIVLVGPYIWLSYLPNHKEIGKLEEDLKSKKDKLKIAKQKAAKLAKLKKEMEIARQQFNIAKRALPEKEEIPSLLTNISHSGQDANLEFLLFSPKKEVPMGFYSEIPVEIKVLGDYHNFVLFCDKVSRLSRIVNIKNVRMIAGEKDTGLITSCTAVTYKFIEEETKDKG